MFEVDCIISHLTLTTQQSQLCKVNQSKPTFKPIKRKSGKFKEIKKKHKGNILDETVIRRISSRDQMNIMVTKVNNTVSYT